MAEVSLQGLAPVQYIYCVYQSLRPFGPYIHIQARFLPLEYQAIELHALLERLAMRRLSSQARRREGMGSWLVLLGLLHALAQLVQRS